MVLARRNPAHALLIPSAFVVMTVLCFDFLGDGLRDATDPYRST